MLNDIKMKKKTVAELGHNARLKIYVDPKKFTSTLALSTFLQKWLGIFGIISRTLILIGIKIKKNC